MSAFELRPRVRVPAADGGSQHLPQQGAAPRAPGGNVACVVVHVALVDHARWVLPSLQREDVVLTRVGAELGRRPPAVALKLPVHLLALAVSVDKFRLQLNRHPLARLSSHSIGKPLGIRKSNER